jgi:hypothetical protein
MNKSGEAYRRVHVIGQKSALGIVQFEGHHQKQEFKKWVEKYGGQVKAEKNWWFGDNVDKEARERERAVGKVKKALMKVREARTDVERDYRRGRVWVGRELVAQWDDMFKAMQFRGEGKTIKTEYERMMKEERAAVEKFSD